ncbi:MAG TPA: hypothetical protein VHV79_10155 [Mycobacteriales bacterium]|jgi:hypothetical protein|nr:hypothetical protein [Mycobacteriales bacterium]
MSTVEVPPELIGAWRRSGLFIDGVRQIDYCDVLWLQSSTWFADIRLRLDPAAEPLSPAARRMARPFASAGTATWADPIFTWTSTLGNSGPPDANSLNWEDGVVVERGTIALDHETFTFAEEWLRMNGESDEPIVTCRDRYLHIAVGKWAIAASASDNDGPLIAKRLKNNGHTWTEVGSVQV